MHTLITAPRFSMALRELTDHARGEVINCTPVTDSRAIAQMNATLESNDPAKLLPAIDHMVKSYRFATAHYIVTMGEDPDNLTRVGYIIYLRPHSGDRAKLPPQVYYLSTK